VGQHQVLALPSINEFVSLLISRRSFTESRRALYPERTYSQSFLTKIYQGSEETSNSDLTQDSCTLQSAWIFALLYHCILFKRKYSFYF